VDYDRHYKQALSRDMFEILHCDFCTFTLFDFENKTVVWFVYEYLILIIYIFLNFLTRSWISVEEVLFLRTCGLRSRGISGMNSFVV